MQQIKVHEIPDEGTKRQEPLDNPFAQYIASLNEHELES